MTTHSSILAWKIPWTGELGGSLGHKELDRTELLHLHFSLSKEIESHAVIAADLQQPLREFREE